MSPHAHGNTRYTSHTARTVLAEPGTCHQIQETSWRGRKNEVARPNSEIRVDRELRAGRAGCGAAPDVHPRARRSCGSRRNGTERACSLRYPGHPCGTYSRAAADARARARQEQSAWPACPGRARVPTPLSRSAADRSAERQTKIAQALSGKTRAESTLGNADPGALIGHKPLTTASRLFRRG